MNYFSTLITLLTFLPPPYPPSPYSQRPESDPPEEEETLATLTHAHTTILQTALPLLHPPVSETRRALLLAVGENAGEEDPSQIPRFAFVAGAVGPLFVVARGVGCVEGEEVGTGKTREVSGMGVRGETGGWREMRERAVELLEGEGEGGWREGAWDSCVMAGIARRGWVGG